MDKKIQIQLNEFKNVDSINVDMYDKIELNNKRKNIVEFDSKKTLNVSDQYDLERQTTEIYRIYGSIEYFSLLNNIKTDYKYLSDFFLKENNLNIRNFLNTFDIYLVKPSTTFEKYNNNYTRFFDVIATPTDIDIINAGFSKNLFNEQKYSFIIKKDIDVSEYFDDLGFPLTDIYLYFVYKKSKNGYNEDEEMFYTYWLSNQPSILEFNYNGYDIGDLVYGDVITYNKNNFLQTQLFNQSYKIKTYYKNDDDTGNKILLWEYNPFIPIKLRYFSNEVQRTNTGNTSYEQTNQIPIYATDLNDGNFVWRDILEQGYIDPLTGNGVDYPFINGRRYLFNYNILSITPDLSDINTSQVFNEINIENYNLRNFSPVSNLNNINKPCQ